jgi:uncharacterized membrane protein
MFIMFVTAIPVIGWIMIFVWAFTGEDESRKNYFRAILAWILLFVALLVFLALIAGWPNIQHHIESWVHKH